MNAVALRTAPPRNQSKPKAETTAPNPAPPASPAAAAPHEDDTRSPFQKLADKFRK